MANRQNPRPQQLAFYLMLFIFSNWVTRSLWKTIFQVWDSKGINQKVEIRVKKKPNAITINLIP